VKSARILDLFDHVRRGLEADEGVVGDHRSRQDRQGDGRPLGRLSQPRGVAAAADHEHPDHDDHDHETAQLDRRHHEIRAERLTDAAGVECSDDREEDDRDGNGRQVEERAEVVAGERDRQARGARHAGREHAEPDQERDDGAVEGALREDGCPAGARILGDQLGVRPRGQQREQESEKQRCPQHPADLLGQHTHQGVDAGAEHVAQDEGEQQGAGDGATQASGLLRRRGGVGSHPGTVRTSVPMWRRG